VAAALLAVLLVGTASVASASAAEDTTMQEPWSATDEASETEEMEGGTPGTSGVVPPDDSQDPESGPPGEGAVAPETGETESGGPSALDEAPEASIGAGTKGQAEVPEPMAAPAQVPSDETQSGATIVVHVGGDRTGPAAVSSLAGVELALHDAASGAPIATDWSVAVSDDAGQAVFDVPGDATGVAYLVKRTGAPAGWYSEDVVRTGGSGAGVATAYTATTPAIEPGGTYESGSDFMVYPDHGASAIASGGVWQVSRTNPSVPPQCGLDVALVSDLSGSVSDSLSELKTAAKDMVGALAGTPSAVGLYTFAATTGAAVAKTPVTTSANVSMLQEAIDGYAAGGATNWEDGIGQVDGSQYDVVMVLTDGNPTVDSTGGPGSNTFFRQLERGVFAANAVKASGAAVVAFGVGSGVSGAVNAYNLRAISGTTAGVDYFQTEDYASAGEMLVELATASCRGTVSVVKEVVDGDQATAAGGWDITLTPGAGLTGEPVTLTTAADTGAVNFPLAFAPGALSGQVTIAETPQAGYAHLPNEDGSNAVCAVDGEPLPVTNVAVDDTGAFTVPVHAQQSVTCTVRNRVVHDPTWTLAKSSDPVTGSQVETGSEITYTLRADNTGSIDVSDAVVTDDLSGVLAHADLIGQLPSGATLDGTTLTWHVPMVKTGEHAVLTYTVRVHDDAHDKVLRNVATPGGPGTCPDGECSTEHTTPPIEVPPTPGPTPTPTPAPGPGPGGTTPPAGTAPVERPSPLTGAQTGTARPASLATTGDRLAPLALAALVTLAAGAALVIARRVHRTKD
jgi:uncharacterized repeat protein (TIGR01451 family)